MNKQDQYAEALDHLVRSFAYQPEDVAEDLVCLAEGVWYRGFTPKLKNYSGDELLRAGYVVEYLATNHLVNNFRRGALLASLQAAKRRTEFPPKYSAFYFSEKTNKLKVRDKLAWRWGFSSGLKPSKVKGLLDLQRRANQAAYKPEKSAA